MRYHYSCAAKDRCKISGLPEEFFEGEMEDLELALDSKSLEIDEDGAIDLESPLIWVVEHPMKETPEVTCPACKGKARRSIQKVGAVYIRGNGYLDKQGCLRDMNLYKLQKQDPYGHMREPGEKDHLINKFKKAGKKGGNQKPLYSYKKST